MKKRSQSLQSIHLLLVIIGLSTSCNTVFEEEPSLSIATTEFSEGFSFDTKQTITLELPATSSAGKYNVYIIVNGVEEFHSSYNSALSFSDDVTLTSAASDIKVELVSTTETVSAKFSVADNSSISVNFGSSGARTTENCQDRLYAVENSFGGFWEIDLVDGNYAETQLSNLTGGGSIACALDQENGYMYYNVNRTMYRYDIENNTFETVFTSNPFNGSYPRMEYKDGFFYMSNGSRMYKVDASTNEVAASYRISGFVNSTSGGDLAFASDGSLYLACFSGLYRFTEINDEEGTAQIERLSAENFPYQLTSMAIDRRDDIYVGTNDANSNLIRMSIQDGSFEIVRTYNHKINDLTAWRCAEEDLSEVDTDGDGVIDELDDYPEDAEVAFTQYTPSELGKGSLAFEDNWPSVGDYDFNDMIVNYRYVYFINAANQAVRCNLEFDLTAMGATFHNGFGVELPTEERFIESVSGYEITRDLVTLGAKGLEAGQDNPVIIVFDDAFDHMGNQEIVNTRDGGNSAPVKSFKIVMEFAEPIDPAQIPTAKFNPFIFINGDRTRELHLKDGSPTNKMDVSFLGTMDDNSTGNRRYKAANNAPWAIDISHSFRYPQEGQRIDKGYKRFLDWALTEGSQYGDWYTDAPGNRNTSRLYLR